MARIKVLSAGAVQAMVSALGEKFAAANGHTLDLNFATVGSLRERLSGGEAADLAVLSASAIDALAPSGIFVAGSRTDLGRTLTGLCVREGAPSPDVSTVEAFKRTLLDARTVAYTDPKGGGSSGIFFAGLLGRLGIAEAVGKKAVFTERGHEVAEVVARGEAEIGSTFVSEILRVKGARVAGLLPAGLDNINMYTGAVLARAANPKPATALLHALSDPATRPRWAEAGLEPAF
jgi:molybdate transport system substrate-binding protein